MDVDLVKRIEEIAKRENLSFSQVVDSLVKKGTKLLKEDKPEQRYNPHRNVSTSWSKSLSKKSVKG